MKLYKLINTTIFGLICLSSASCSFVKVEYDDYKVVETGPFTLKVDNNTKEAVIIDSNVEEINRTLDFNNNIYLKKYNIIGIGNKVFENASKLEKIFFSNNMLFIGEDAFYNCNNLQEIDYNNSSVEVHSSAFSGVDFTKITYNTPKNVDYYPSFGNSKERFFENNVVYEDSLKEKVVGVFYDDNQSKSITIDSNTKYVYINSIPIEITNINLPDNLIDIDISYTSLFNVNLSVITPKNVTFNEYENGYYLGNNNNEYMLLVGVIDRNCNEFVINNDTKFINEHAFENCKNLKEITIPDKINKISEYTFYNSGIEQINLHNNIYKIEDRAFAYSKLKDISLPSNLKVMGYELFAGTNIKTIDVPNKVQYINSSFINMANVETINITDSTSYISSGSFANCINLININLPKICSWLSKSCFTNCQSLVSVTLPYGIKKIESYDSIIPEITIEKLSYFGNCHSLKKVYIPESVVYVDKIAFKYVENVSIYLQHKEIPLTFEENWNYNNIITLNYDIFC